ncbi:flagellar biosynthetic protein FliR [Falsigemmobacter faecalis]|uniref:Type III secretion protein n=1 Tax=Falsigemmobacter faecalis TaxID=2488730 RepID=A0A3P3DNS5_9RHOB|nr:flagellar biosynthetic protein FliR [Falsigemmobacter faecalis]RRH74288.1 type III secretion protein [Falsigemmobacter faecalis]
MTPLEELLSWGTGAGSIIVQAGVLCFLRAGAFIALLPALGEQIIPARIRLAAALCLTAVVTPALSAPAAISIGSLLAEAGNGLLLGAGFRFFLMALQVAGMMAAQAGSLAQIFTGPGSEPQSGISNLLTYAALALLCAMGLPEAAAALLISSYELLPQGASPLSADAAAWGVTGVSRSFRLALSFAAPFLIGGLLYNVAIGAINRAMPMLMVVLIGAPALTLGALVLLVSATPIILALWLTEVQIWLDNPFAPGGGL